MLFRSTIYKSLTEDLVREAFNDILPAKVEVPITEKIEKVAEKVADFAEQTVQKAKRGRPKTKKSEVSLTDSSVTSNETIPNPSLT